MSDREALADLIESVAGRDIGYQADVILASDWLKEQRAEARAEAEVLLVRVSCRVLGLLQDVLVAYDSL